MIYLTNGNMPLNAAYADEIVQEDNSTYQLTFRFPTSDSLWDQLKEEAFLTADDLHGEQDFVIFEVEKKHGYIQVYAKQVFTLLNNYVVSSLTLDRATGSTALSRFAGAITRDNPFSFFSDIEDRHTFNIGSKNAMEAFAKDKHSIIGQWGGDLVRHGYQVRLLKNGGSENESLFMYKKNLSSYQHKTSTKSLKTRITFIATVKGEGEKAPDRKLSVVVDSPLINKYSQIYEDVIEVNDRDVKDEASLRKYGEQYYRTSLCDMMEDSLELEVVGQSDVPVQMFDIVSLFHDVYNLDVRKKITKYTYSPMAKKLKSIGFGQFQSGLANAIGNAVSDAVKGEAQQFQDDFERQLARELKNADLAFDRKTEELKNEFEDGLNATRAKAEEVKRELSDTIDQRFNSFNNGPLQEAKRRAEEALRNAGAVLNVAQEAKQISEQLRSQLDNKADLVEFQRVKETNQLYERIIGSSESDIAEKVSRMAMTSQLFQVEVGKYANVGGPNMLRNSRADAALKHWTEDNGRLGFTAHGFYFNGEKRMFELRPGAVVKSNRFLVKRNADYILNILGFDNNSKYFRVYFCKRKKDSSMNFQQKQLVFDGKTRWVDGSVFDNSRAVKKTFKFNVGDYDDGYLQFEYDRNNPDKWGGLFMTELDFYEGSTDRLWQPAPEDATLETDEAVRTVQNQLANSWAIQNLTSAGSIVSQINATNNQILIEAEKIRLKGKTLLDELTAIQGYFKRLFVGEGDFAKLNAEIIGSRTITADKLIMDQAMARMFVSSDIFTDTLAAKEAFINKLRSVVVSATLLEGYKGKIGGFQIGTHDNDPNSYWLTGQNQFAVGMGNGVGKYYKTALWVNWGNDWGKPDQNAWYVMNSGKMVCGNEAEFKRGAVFEAGSISYGSFTFYDIAHFQKNIFMLGGGDIYGTGSTPRSNGQNAVVWWSQIGDGTVKYWIDRVSDRRLKRDIVDTDVNAIDRINQLRMVAFDFIKTGKHEEIGLIAQEVEAILPSAISKNPEKEDDYLHIDYVAIVPYLIKAVQELNQKIEKLEKTA